MAELKNLQVQNRITQKNGPGKSDPLSLKVTQSSPAKKSGQVPPDDLRTHLRLALLEQLKQSGLKNNPGLVKF